MNSAIENSKKTTRIYTQSNWQKITNDSAFAEFLETATGIKTLQVQLSLPDNTNKNRSARGLLKWRGSPAFPVTIEWIEQKTKTACKITFDCDTATVVKKLLALWRSGFQKKLSTKNNQVTFISATFPGNDQSSAYAHLVGTIEKIDINPKTTWIAPVPIGALINGTLAVNKAGLPIENYQVPIQLLPPLRQLGMSNGRYEIETKLAPKQLAPIRTWMAIDVALDRQQVTVTALIPEKSSLISLMAIPENFTLGSLVGFADLLPGIDLQQALPDNIGHLKQLKLTSIEISASLETASIGQIAFRVESKATWSPLPGKIDINGLSIRCAVNQPFQPKSRQTTIDIEGKLSLAGKPLRIIANAPDMTIFAYSGSGVELNLTRAIKSLAPGTLPIPKIVPGIALKDIVMRADAKTKNWSLQAKSATSWEVIPRLVTIKNLSTTLQRIASGNTKKTTVATIGGEVKLFGTPIKASVTLPGDIVIKGECPQVNLGELFKKGIKFSTNSSLTIPGKVLDIKLDDVDVTVMPKAPAISIAAAVGDGVGAEWILTKSKQGKWLVGAGIMLDDNWSFASISSGLKVLDTIKISNAVIVASSSDSSTLGFQRVSMPGDNLQLIKGLNFAGSLNLVGSGVDKLLGIERLVMQAALSTDIKKVALTGSVEGNIELAQGIVMSKAGVRVFPGGATPEFGIFCQVAVQAQKDRLLFTGAMSVTPNGASFAATMEGVWRNVFDARGFDLFDLAIELGISFQGLPSIGVTGHMTLNDITGGAAIAFNSANPAESMLAIEFDHLPFGLIISELVDPKVKKQLGGFIKTINKSSLDDVNIQVVPVTTRIGEITFEKGITIAGALAINGWDARIHAGLDYTSGILLEGEMDPIIVGDIFSIKGKGKYKYPSLKMDFRLGNTPSLIVAGSVNLLGISGATLVEYSDTGFVFSIQGRIFELFEASLDVAGKDMYRAPDFRIAATMKNDLLKYLNKEVRKGLKTAANEANRELSKAQTGLAIAQREANKLTKTVKAARNQVKREKAAQQRALKKAKAGVAKQQKIASGLSKKTSAARKLVAADRKRAQKAFDNTNRQLKKARAKVNTLNNNIRAMKNKVQAEQNRATADIRAAEKKIAVAKSKVNTLNRSIRASKKRLSNYKKKAKKQWYNPKWGGLISKEGITIGGLETAKATANEALKVTRGFLATTRRSVKILPVESDPRVAGLLVSKEVADKALAVAQAAVKTTKGAAAITPIDTDPRVAALIIRQNATQGALAIAQEALNVASGAIDLTPVDVDPRVAGPLALREAADSTLEGLKLSLEGVKIAVKQGAAAAGAIARYGLGGVFDVKSAAFKGSLSAVDGGTVNFKMQVKLMGKSKKITIEFNFKDIEESIENLVTTVLVDGLRG